MSKYWSVVHAKGGLSTLFIKIGFSNECDNAVLSLSILSIDFVSGLRTSG